MPSRSGRDSKRGRPLRSVRRETDLQRRPAGSRAERRTVLIVTNGNRTEVDYFEAVRKEEWLTAGKVRVKFEKGTLILTPLRIMDASLYFRSITGVVEFQEAVRDLLANIWTNRASSALAW